MLPILMRIAMIGQKGIPAISGGVEKHVEELSVHLVSQGHEVVVYTRAHYFENPGADYKGVSLKEVFTISSKHLDAIVHAFFATLHVIFDRRIDLVHYHAIGPSLVIPLIRLLRPRLPVVATYHSRDYLHGKWNIVARKILRLGEWFMCRLAREVIVVSRTNQRYLEQRYGRDMHYIPNGTPLQADKDYPVPQNLPLVKDGFFLLVGRLIPVKCFDDVINAYLQLKTDKKLVIAGDSSFTDEYAAGIRALAEGSENILFVGHQTPKQLAILYSNAYVFINSSSVEGLSIAVLEAMSYGCATLVSDIDGNLEAVGEEGMTYPQGDVQALKSKLQELLRDDTRVRENGSYCRQRIAERFDWRDIVLDTINVYQVASHAE